MFSEETNLILNSQNVAFVNRFQAKEYEDSMRPSTAFLFPFDHLHLRESVKVRYLRFEIKSQTGPALASAGPCLKHFCGAPLSVVEMFLRGWRNDRKW